MLLQRAEQLELITPLIIFTIIAMLCSLRRLENPDKGPLPEGGRYKDTIEGNGRPDRKPSIFVIAIKDGRGQDNAMGSLLGAEAPSGARREVVDTYQGW